MKEPKASCKDRINRILQDWKTEFDFDLLFPLIL